MSVRLRCTKWSQLVSIYRRDLVHGELFLRTDKPPPLAAPMRIHLILPSGTSLELFAVVDRLQSEDAGRGTGVVLMLGPLDPDIKLQLETAVNAAIAIGTRESVAKSPGDSESLSLDDGRALIAAAADLHQALTTEAETFEKLNAFQILGVGYGATDTNVRAAFSELSRRYHPDRFVRYQSEEISRLAEELLITARDAFKATATAELRLELHEQIKRERRPRRPPPPELLRLTRRSRSAAVTARHGPVRDNRESPPAVKEIYPSTELDPLIAFPNAGAVFAENRFAEAAELFSFEARRDKDSTAARAGVELAEGMRALERGDRLEAAQHFEAVLDLHPANEVAADELARMRRRATEQRQGHLAMLMKDTR